MSNKTRVSYDYEAQSSSELTVKAGDILSVEHKHESGWWIVEINGKKGAVPGSYCEDIIINVEKIEKSVPVEKEEKVETPRVQDRDNSKRKSTDLTETSKRNSTTIVAARAIQDFKTPSSGNPAYSKGNGYD